MCMVHLACSRGSEKPGSWSRVYVLLNRWVKGVTVFWVGAGRGAESWV